MCNNTKQKIADALCQLMRVRSFDRITVQNLTCLRWAAIFLQSGVFDK